MRQIDQMNINTTQRMHAAFLRACEWDVAVRKPGNVSDASPGHGMHAALFRASAAAAAKPLFAAGTSVGQRIEAAVAATWAVAGCNTNLGIVLLCAPLARTVDLHPQATHAAALRNALQDVLAQLTVADAAAAFRAIAQAQPAGLGQVPDQDVHSAPSLDLRAAMALAAERDSIARQYRDGYADLFETALPVLTAQATKGPTNIESKRVPNAPDPAAIQALYMHLLSVFADSHIVRKHGPAAGHSVMQFAQVWCRLNAAALTSSSASGSASTSASTSAFTSASAGVAAAAGAAIADTGDGAAQREPLPPDLAAWDDRLKASGINPGTTADLTVATLMLFGYLHGPF
jgi:triphosphoribosyl-dephospho-CoA synthase